ncbi:alpha/beta fold hydrolase [Baekduia soli]|uniref:Alpha/beta fold hydrolase n=1 Tax=Baekduia soli TaxID=496014 RepID=A0A5B8U2Q9_9ACTN|nr:alpha/beta fold hydrolase [Baekduia soli]QEC47306.1 alpha/beta fold hydrolase [Baekduia soli]
MPEISPALYRAGSGEPLVLVHGFTATWRCWLPVLAELVPRFEVIAPTLDGHDGGRPLPPRDTAHTIPHAADHLEEVLDGLGVGTAHFAGNSLGGALGLELARRGRARSVVGISPAGGLEPGDRRSAEAIMKVFRRMQNVTRASERHLPQIMSRPGLRRLALRDVMTRGHLVPAGEALRLARSSLRCDIVDDVFSVLRDGNAALTGLGDISCPVLVTWGDRDRILPVERHSARLRAEIPGVEFRLHRGIGHTPMWDDAALIASTIADFAGAASGPPATATPAPPTTAPVAA